MTWTFALEVGGRGDVDCVVLVEVVFQGRRVEAPDPGKVAGPIRIPTVGTECDLGERKVGKYLESKKTKHCQLQHSCLPLADGTALQWFEAVSPDTETPLSSDGS